MESLFRLGGKDYTLSHVDVEERLKRVSPKPIEKYFVVVNGKPYPPKQALAVALDLPLVSFTTMDANRVLSGLGFDLGQVGDKGAVNRTESEYLFEEYLNSRGLSIFSFEKQFEATSKRPDYSVVFGGTEILFDVKEFHASADDFRPGVGAYDPYRPLREKIEAGRKKFRDLEEYCCCLVLYNREKPLVHLEWQFIYGAMLGNLGWQMPFDVSAGRARSEEAKGAFLQGGKMLRYDRRGTPVNEQNTTISAILALRQLKIGYRRFEADVRREERGLGRKLTLDEYWALIERARGTERDVSMTQLRVVVHENPYARKPLPAEIFRGPYDERYGSDSDGRLTRVFAGEQILRLGALGS